MHEYLITDTRTLETTWVPANSVREALIAHENGWRFDRMPACTRATVHLSGNYIDAALGESACRGRREDVVQ